MCGKHVLVGGRRPASAGHVDAKSTTVYATAARLPVPGELHRSSRRLDWAVTRGWTPATPAITRESGVTRGRSGTARASQASPRPGSPDEVCGGSRVRRSVNDRRRSIPRRRTPRLPRRPCVRICRDRSRGFRAVRPRESQVGTPCERPRTAAVNRCG